MELIVNTLLLCHILKTIASYDTSEDLTMFRNYDNIDSRPFNDISTESNSGYPRSRTCRKDKGRCRCNNCRSRPSSCCKNSCNKKCDNGVPKEAESFPTSPPPQFMPPFMPAFAPPQPIPVPFPMPIIFVHTEANNDNTTTSNTKKSTTVTKQKTDTTRKKSTESTLKSTKSTLKSTSVPHKTRTRKREHTSSTLIPFATKRRGITSSTLFMPFGTFSTALLRADNRRQFDRMDDYNIATRSLKKLLPYHTVPEQRSRKLPKFALIRFPENMALNMIQQLQEERRAILARKSLLEKEQNLLMQRTRTIRRPMIYDIVQ